MSEYYSDLKAAWHLDRIQTLRAGEQIVPIELQFILSDLCNQDCYFCAYRSEVGLSAEQFVEYSEDGTRNHNPNRMISRDKAFEILDDAWELGVRSIIFTGGGEPTVHPDHLEIFAYALSLGFDCSLNTNGLLQRKGWEQVLSCFKYVRFSIDAGCAEDYARVRRVPASQYAKVLQHLKAAVEACALRGCVVGAGYVITPDNYEALVEGVEHIRNTGAAYVRLASMQSTEGLSPFEQPLPDIPSCTILQDVRQRIVAAKQLETPMFQVVDLFDTAMGQVPADAFCGMQQFVLYLGGNLKLYRCCYTAYTELGEIGDLSEQSFATWFQSEQKRSAIGQFDARDCGTCPLEHKNATIRYMTDPAPSHVNFV